MFYDIFLCTALAVVHIKYFNLCQFYPSIVRIMFQPWTFFLIGVYDIK